MTEIVSAAISAGVALMVAILAHRRAVRIQKAELGVKEDSTTNERIRTITDAYEGLLTQMRGEIERLVEVRSIDRERWEKQERILLDRIKVLEHNWQNEKNERERLQARIDRLEQDLKLMSLAKGDPDLQDSS